MFGALQKKIEQHMEEELVKQLADKGYVDIPGIGRLILMKDDSMTFEPLPTFVRKIRKQKR